MGGHRAEVLLTSTSVLWLTEMQLEPKHDTMDFHVKVAKQL